MMADYWDGADGDFFFTPRRHEPLISRPKSFQDQSIPSAGAVAVRDLLRLAAYTGRADWQETAERVLRRYQTDMTDNPHGMASMLIALDFALRRPVEVVIAGSPASPGSRRLLQQTHQLYLPNEVVCLLPPGAATPFADALTRGRAPIDGEPAAYVCRHATCAPPVTSPAELRQLLANPPAAMEPRR
jgi:uncharacterized protein YyaL (SSP411 family)